MQYVISLHEVWDPEKIVENIRSLRSQIRWKNFKLTYDELTYEKKGYFVVNFSHDEPERKSSIHIWRDKVEITSKNWEEIVQSTVMLIYVLKEGTKNIFLDSLLRDYKRTGEFNKQYQELCLDILKSQYLDLVEGKVPKELFQSTKENVRLTLELMLQVVEEIR